MAPLLPTEHRMSPDAPIDSRSTDNTSRIQLRVVAGHTRTNALRQWTRLVHIANNDALSVRFACAALLGEHEHQRALAKRSGNGLEGSVQRQVGQRPALRAVSIHSTSVAAPHRAIGLCLCLLLRMCVGSERRDS